MRQFKDLKVWNKGMALCRLIYDLTAQFPEEERYGLSNQLKRASISVISNIAEGSAGSNAQFKRYLKMSLGSCLEIEAQLLLAKEIHLISENAIDTLILEVVALQKMLSKFITFLGK